MSYLIAFALGCITTLCVLGFIGYLQEKERERRDPWRRIRRKLRGATIIEIDTDPPEELEVQP